MTCSISCLTAIEMTLCTVNLGLVIVERYGTSAYIALSLSFLLYTDSTEADFVGLSMSRTLVYLKFLSEFLLR